MDTQVKGLDSVKEYYGKILQTNNDLKTSACCTTESIPEYLKPILSMIHDEVMSKFYGCGSPMPLNLEGKTILDLGSGSGRDCFLLSYLVGENGKVIGVDMTDEQIEVAKKHQDYHAKKFNYKTSNITFLKGYIEDLESIGIESSSIDIVISNCVINLSPAKGRVFNEIFRVLKPGGELYFSDIFSSRRIPDHIKQDDIFVGECLGGALYTEDFRRILLDNGIKDYRFYHSTKLDIFNNELKKRAGNIDFYSQTVRAFKMELEDKCEDYGQALIYKGTIKHSESFFILDDHHLFEKGKVIQVCGNTADMIMNSHYKNHFTLIGDKENHFGLFDCDTSKNDNSNANSMLGSCC